MPRLLCLTKGLMDKLSTKRYKLIHEAIHDPAKTAVIIDNKKLPIKQGANGKRYVSWKGATFIVQDPKRSSTYATMMKYGAKITRILRSSAPWGLIVNGQIEKP